MKIQFHRIDTNVVVGLLVREFCCSGTDVSAKVLAMYAGTRTPSMEPQWLAAGLSQGALQMVFIIPQAVSFREAVILKLRWQLMQRGCGYFDLQHFMYASIGFI